MARPTRDQLAEHYRLEWLVERATAETVPCPPKHKGGCSVPAGQTCISGVWGQELQGPPAHAARIRAAADRPAAREPARSAA